RVGGRRGRPWTDPGGGDRAPEKAPRGVAAGVEPPVPLAGVGPAGKVLVVGQEAGVVVVDGVVVDRRDGGLELAREVEPQGVQVAHRSVPSVAGPRVYQWGTARTRDRRPAAADTLRERPGLGTYTGWTTPLRTASAAPPRSTS